MADARPQYPEPGPTIARISMRGRVAYAIRCLEIACDHLDYPAGSHLREMITILGEFPTMTDLALWINEVDDYLPCVEEELEALKRPVIAKESRDLLFTLVEIPCELAEADPKDDEEALEPLLEALAILTHLGATAPDLGPYKKAVASPQDPLGPPLPSDFFEV